MPILFLLIGVVLIMTAIRGNQNAVFTQLETDLIGSGSTPGFFVWVGAILVLAVFGQITGLKLASKALITLIVAIYIVAQNGFFTQFSQAFTNLQAPAATPANQVGASTDVQGQSTPASSSPNSSAGNGVTPSTPSTSSATSPANTVQSALPALGNLPISFQ